MGAVTALGETAWYVYAIVRQGAVAPPTGAAILPGASLDLVSAMGGGGMDGLAALVSLVPRALFAPDNLASRAAEPDWVAARASAHHAVVSSLHAASACLPLGFGTLFSSTEGVRSWLRGNDRRFHDALALVAGRHEWGVTLTEDSATHAAWVRAHDAGVATLAAALANAGPGAGFLLARRIERAVAASGAAHAREFAAAIGDRLTARLTVLAEAPPAGAVAAWSVLSAQDDGLAALLSELDGAAAPTGLALRAAGPFPPYAFARAAWQGGLHG